MPPRKKTLKTPQQWKPVPGAYASYTGKTSRLLRGAGRVRVIAEASNKRTMVEAIGYKGRPVRFPVMTANLGEPRRDLLDLLEETGGQ